MKPGTGCDIKHPLCAALLEHLDEEITFALVARIPIDELVPLINKALDIFLLIMVRIPDINRIGAEILYAFLFCSA